MINEMDTFLIHLKKQRIFISFLILLFITDVITFSIVSLENIDKFFACRNLSTDSSSIAVLFHGFASNRKTIDDETKRRVNFGVFLYQQEISPLLILSGGRRLDNEKSGAFLMAEYAVERGIPIKNILVEDSSFDSKTNLGNVAKLNYTRGSNSDLILVSSPFHLWRIRAISDYSHSNIYFNPYRLGKADPEISRLELWRSAHYNFIVYLMNMFFPDFIYDRLVQWIRYNTTF